MRTVLTTHISVRSTALLPLLPPAAPGYFACCTAIPSPTLPPSRTTALLLELPLLLFSPVIAWAAFASLHMRTCLPALRLPYRLYRRTSCGLLSLHTAQHCHSLPSPSPRTFPAAPTNYLLPLLYAFARPRKLTVCSTLKLAAAWPAYTAPYHHLYLGFAPPLDDDRAVAQLPRAARAPSCHAMGIPALPAPSTFF